LIKCGGGGGVLEQGCDASVMLASRNHGSEKDSPDNLSLAGDGFDTVIKAKAAVDSVPTCRNKVSCADILAMATRDVVALVNYYASRSPHLFREKKKEKSTVFLEEFLSILCIKLFCSSSQIHFFFLKKKNKTYTFCNHNLKSLEIYNHDIPCFGHF
jgi:hypothetical protein